MSEHEELQRQCDALAAAWEEGFAAGKAWSLTGPPNPYEVPFGNGPTRLDGGECERWGQ